MPNKPIYKWIAAVHTGSNRPDAGDLNPLLLNKDARTIAEELASATVSPKGPVSGMRMLVYYINRAGSKLPESRRAELERAKRILHKKLERPGQNDLQQRAS